MEREASEAMTKDHWIEIYRIIVNEQYECLRQRHTRMVFYSGLLTALLAAAVFVFVRSSGDWQHYVLLVVVGVSLCYIAHNAKQGIMRWTISFLDAVIMRAKIEQKLGLSISERPKQEIQEEELYWPNEPIVAPRLLQSRRDYKTSEDFFHGVKRQGVQEITEKLMTAFMLIGCVLGLFGCVMIGILILE